MAFQELMVDLVRKEKGDTQEIEVLLEMHWKELLDLLVNPEEEDPKDWMDHQENQACEACQETKE